MTAKFKGIQRMIALALVLAATAAAAMAEEGEFYVNTLRDLGKVSPQNSRTMAMGGGGRGLANGTGSLGINPAALGALHGSEFDIGLGIDWLDDGDDNTDQVSFKVGGAVNLDKWTKNACMRNQAIGGLLETKSYAGAAGTSMKRNQTSGLFGYGVHLMDDLLVGASVSLFTGKWKSDYRLITSDAGGDDEPTEYEKFNRRFIGGDFKVGGLYRVKDETTIGGTIGYTTGTYKEKVDAAVVNGVSVPETTHSGTLRRYSIGAGIAHQYAEDTLILGDLWYERVKTRVPAVREEAAKSWGASVGIEQRVIPELLALRGGLYYEHVSFDGEGKIIGYVPNDHFSKGRFGITAGAGLRLYNFDLGYSLDVNSNGTVKNMVDFSTQW